jgi:hypothetical protein
LDHYAMLCTIIHQIIFDPTDVSLPKERACVRACVGERERERERERKREKERERGRESEREKWR